MKIPTDSTQAGNENQTSALSAIAFVKGDEAVTSSETIARGTGHDHRQLLRLIRDHITDFEDFGRVRFENAPFETAGGAQSREIVLLNEHQATLLITFMRNLGVVKEFKKALVRAFYELRRQASLAPARDPMDVLRDPAAMRGLLLTYSEKVLALETTVAEQAPKVVALDKLATRTDGALCITDSAKALQMPPKELFDYLSRKQWIYRRAGGKNWLGYQEKVQRGLLEHKVTSITVGNEEKLREQVLITAKGLAMLAEILTPMTLADYFSRKQCLSARNR